MDRLYQARIAYRAAFGNDGPQPSGVSDEDLAEALEFAVRGATPIPDDRDWTPDRERKSPGGGEVVG